MVMSYAELVLTCMKHGVPVCYKNGKTKTKQVLEKELLAKIEKEKALLERVEKWAKGISKK